MAYKCSKCNMPVVVINDKVIKVCKCEAPIIAEISATATGKGNVK
jgi:hypothetical protein